MFKFVYCVGGGVAVHDGSHNLHELWLGSIGRDQREMLPRFRVYAAERIGRPAFGPFRFALRHRSGRSQIVM